MNTITAASWIMAVQRARIRRAGTAQRIAAQITLMQGSSTEERRTHNPEARSSILRPAPTLLQTPSSEINSGLSWAVRHSAGTAAEQERQPCTGKPDSRERPATQFAAACGGPDKIRGGHQLPGTTAMRAQTLCKSTT